VDENLPKERHGGSLNMQRESSSSVRVFYPRFNRDEIIQKIKDKLESLDSKLSLKSVILFGSYAKGNYTAFSDIDLMVIYKGSQREDAYRIARKTLLITSLELHIYSENEYKQIKDTIDRMIKDGIIIYEA
ncbi:MAG: nucleotidyltransferase domain-containing protein, partial [Candidatus Poribacteria bacterium]